MKTFRWKVKPGMDVASAPSEERCALVMAILSERLPG
ncbi:Minor tail protein M [Escherichia coli]|nr:Minor tail protein M [Escherichia coli]CAD5727828.1 Minor tail protein M [Escherichia coli]